MATKNKVYAVVHGYNPGIYQHWEGETGAEAQVKGYPGALFRSFHTYQEAVIWFETQSGGVKPRSFGFTTPIQEKLLDSPLHMQQTGQTGNDYLSDLKAGKVVIFTDGSSIGNPGPGGYGAVLLKEDHRRELSGGYRWTTNNRMELMACIQAIKALQGNPNVVLYSDSSYVVRGINEGWARRWRANNWKREQDKQAENADLWADLLELIEEKPVEFRWLAGHAGYAENERCDNLAQEAARAKYLQVDKGFEQ